MDAIPVNIEGAIKDGARSGTIKVKNGRSKATDIKIPIER
jgi:hypothetical protein